MARIVRNAERIANTVANERKHHNAINLKAFFTGVPLISVSKVPVLSLGNYSG